ncbi:MAG: hypothetical protein WAM14_23350 [Candidatus Nitrosopolaris sp.]
MVRQKRLKVKVLKVLDMKNLAEILFFAAGITRVLKLDYGTYYMRAASATGALYPIALYIICQDIPGLKGDFTLTELRSGDYLATLAGAAGDNDDIIRSPVTVAFTSIAWRNAKSTNLVHTVIGFGTLASLLPTY